MTTRSSRNSRRIASLLTTLLLSALAASSLEAQMKKAENLVIRGTVVNSKTREPIPRALVFCPDNRFATLTDDRGRFQFSVSLVEPEPSPEGIRSYAAPNFPYTLMARKPGFLPPSQDQVVLRPDGDLSDLTISLAPESLIVGHVGIPSSDGFERIQVELFRRTVREGAEHWDSAGNTTSRSDGEFRFAELRPGSYKLVTHESLDRDPLSFNPRGPLFGYPPVYFPSAMDFSTASVIQLSAGTTFVADLSPVRREYYPVKIKISNATPDLPLGIQVWPQGHPGPGFSLGYNAVEETLQGMLPDGFYVVQVSAYGPRQLNASASLVVKGAPVSGQTVSLLPSISIPVNFHEEFERQETFAQVSAQSSGGTANQWRRSIQVNLVPIETYGTAGGASLRHPQNPEDDSPPIIENVQPGRYKIVVNTPVGYAASLASGGTDLLTKPLVVSAGGAIPPLDITLRDDGAEISGTIEGASSVPSGRQLQGQVCFIPASEGEGQFRTAWLSPEGSFQLEQLPPGTYRVLAFLHSQSELEYRNAEAMSKYDSLGEVIRVAAGQKQRVRVPLITSDE